MSGYTGKTLYHRLGDQISTYAYTELPKFVQDIADRLNAGPDAGVQAPQTAIQRSAQSKRGAQNPGPGKAVKGLGKLKVGKKT